MGHLRSVTGHASVTGHCMGFKDRWSRAGSQCGLLLNLFTQRNCFFCMFDYTCPVHAATSSSPYLGCRLHAQE